MSRSQGTIVISRDGTADGNRRAFEDSLAAALQARRHRTLMIPHLYHLRPSHPAALLLSGKADGDLLFASWLPPRAAFWTLRALGVSGAPDADPAALNQPCAPSEDGTEGSVSEARTVRCLDLGTFAAIEACVTAVEAAAGPRPASGFSDREEISEPADARWYPVIDYALCTSCRKCVDFCLFGVYSAQGGRVVVTSPDNCKNGCPACARTCPAGAIMFPHYFADPVISGAAPARDPAERRNGDARPLLVPQRADEDGLDRLIGALEKLDG